MKAIQPVTAALAVLAVVTVWATAARQRELQRLRAERQALVQCVSGTTGAAQAATAPSQSAGEGSDAEILQLRSQVAALMARKRELATVQSLNQQLCRALNERSAGTNLTLPAGFIRKSQARFLGYNSPQDTLQSFLWALHNQDLTNLLQALAPAPAQQLQEQIQRSGNDGQGFFAEMQAFVGFQVLEQRQATDGSTQLKIQILPELPPGDIKFHLVNGQWRMDLPH